jgi:Carboxypeptidase regulatory-like domain
MSTRKSMLSLLALLFAVMSVIAVAQAPTGIIEGTVADESGAVIPNATVTITNKATGVSRTATTNASGYYSAPALPPSDYEVRVEVQGFKTTLRAATVQAGGDLQVNMSMSLGGTKDVVTVEGATTDVNYENNQVSGVVEHQTIQDLPFNGRSYIQAAAIEPGVTITPGTTSQFNALFTVSVLGSGNRTVYTIDGGNVSDNIDVGGGISSMNFSQEVVQEFQISTLNFDIATPIASGGAINVVTRSGSNDWHGSLYYFYRDHNIAAYPNLIRSANDPNPYFIRKNPGGWLGGPVIKNKLFFFFNYEYTDQIQALATATTTTSMLALNGTYNSPYTGKTLSLRVDDHLTDKENLFIRYSHDGNAGFSQALEFGDPSNWAHNTNWADQSIIGLTSTLTPNIVNDLHFQYNYWNNHNLQAVPSDCADPCVAGSLPNIFTFVGSNYPAVGPNFNAPQARNTRRYETVEALSWQKGNHRFKFGGDLNPTRSNGEWGFCTPLCTGAVEGQFFASTFVPAYAAAFGGPAGAAAFINAELPGVFNFNGSTLTAVPLRTDADALKLPMYSLNSSIFSGVGVGSISTPAPYGYSQNENYNQYRLYFGDTWKISKTFTLNYGVAWNAQTGFYNSNLPKPAYLAPILGTGSNNLGATVNNTREFQPVFGFAWSPFKNNKTVFRGGGGIYWDSTPGYYKLREAPVIGPLGDGRATLAASEFTNNIPTAFDFNTGKPIPIGAPLPIGDFTNITVGQFTTLVQQELPTISAKLFPSNVQTSGAYTTTGIDVAKQGVEIYPTHFPLARTYQTSLGVQHDLGHNMVIQADWARRQAENYSLGEVDYNLYNRYIGGVRTPVIPVCTAAQQFVAGQECSTGSITFWTDQGRSIYEGLLVKFTKRLSNHFQFNASYALQRETAETVWNDTNYMAGYGQILAHNNFNFSGIYQLPWHFDISMNSSYIGRSPVAPSISNLDLPGTTPAGSSEPLPGLAYGCLNAGCGTSALVAAVNNFNSTVAGTTNANGSVIGKLLVPTGNFALSNPITSQDVRLTKTFVYKERYKIAIMGEVFNIFNFGNETGQSYTLDPATSTSPVFGVPTARVGQTFGSGGPRAFQFGGRFSF